MPAVRTVLRIEQDEVLFGFLPIALHDDAAVDPQQGGPE
jgi:hypothetical protein